MLVDSHHHFWDVARGDYGWLTPRQGPIYRDFGVADLRPLLRAHGISRTVLVQAAPTLAETRYLLALARLSDVVAGVVGWVDFADRRAPERIGELAAEPLLKGLRPMIQDIPDPDWMLRAELDRAFRALIEHRLTFDALVLPQHLSRLHALLARYPELKAVIDHGAKPRIRDGAFEPWAGDLARIARDTGACCKLSGLVTEAGPGWSLDTLRPYADHLLEVFGPERVMWGSDWPVLNLASDYDSWRAASLRLLAGLDEAGRAAVLGATATNFYGLS